MSVKWQDYNLSKHVLNVINKFNFLKMTPVQVATIPVFMNNKDVCVEAVTGSGKTLAFVIPLIEVLLKKAHNLKKHQVGCLIVSPTRELASQIFEVLKSFYDPSKCPFTSSLIIGGQGDIEKDFKKLQSQGCNIVVGTPGRINGLFEYSSSFKVNVRSLEILVLDEADRLLDLGFHKTLNSILSFLPKQRRTGLFSATQTHEVDQLIKAGMRDPVKISVAEKKAAFAAAYTSNVKTPSSLNNEYIVCTFTNKFNTLVDIVKSKKNEKMLLFFATCASVEYFGNALKEFLGEDVSMMLLHGKLRKKRLSLFKKFRHMQKGILACTDVMARGIDIPDVDWVLQYDPPSNATAFVHRCGRTARVGKKGNALVFLLDHETTYVDFIEINQKAPMVEYKICESDTSGIDWLEKLRCLAVSDRAVLERGVRAYVSFIQSYRKHECSLIFRLKDLNFGELATGFALLKLPKMPEMRNKKITGFIESEVDINAIPYRNEQREEQRQKTLQNPDQFSKPKYVPQKYKTFSEARKKREKKKERKAERRKRKLNKLKEAANIAEQEVRELEELEKDFKMIKDLKRRKITSEQYDEAIAAEEKEMFGSSTLT